VYVVGLSNGDLDGSGGLDPDGFLTKYSPTGVLLWIRELGVGVGEDGGTGVAVDGNGDIYVTGTTTQDLDGSLEADSGQNAFIIKYSPAGAPLWAHQFGTPGQDFGEALCVDGDGNVVVVGSTAGVLDGTRTGTDMDVFLVKYSTSGEFTWARQFGSTDSSADEGYGVAADSSGNLYVTGRTSGPLDGSNPDIGGWDAFLAKYSSTGTPLWVRHVGSPQGDSGYGVAVGPDTAVYVAGGTLGDFDDPNAEMHMSDAFVAKYSDSGERTWVEMLDSGEAEEARAVATDGLSVYITGNTDGELPGIAVGGAVSAFVAEYSAAGVFSWLDQFHSNEYTYGTGICVDESNNLFVAGYTTADLDGPVQLVGYQDAFVRRYR
jgi:hypothetical protein